MEQVKLLGNYTSPFNRRVIWALKLKGVPFEFMQEDLYNNKSELLLKSNPVYKKIPVLIHNGKPISESTVILEYIEETWPENPLLPLDPHERATARFWIKFIEDKIPIMFAFFLSIPGEEQDKAIKDWLEVLRTIEEHGLKEDKKFFGGANIGLTDLVFGFLAYQSEPMEEIVGVKLMETHSFPRLHTWAENFKSVSVIKENLPDQDRLKAHIKWRKEMLIGSAHPR
ncbi:glutathione S-transferase U7-like [Macadamia integrifolia]|uniref:glutathione S-transferase U7-like n=1 Tax=Macadamia integrifolia TaxID=60698 RepID=UPI001C4F7A5F|nr:glutathione S-transferase U7-like [Macadamia integrifolia]